MGVEGVSDEAIITALNDAGYEVMAESRLITKADFYSDGFTGSDDSNQKREELKKKLNLPKHLSANMMLDVLNRLYGYDEYKKIVKEMSED